MKNFAIPRDLKSNWSLFSWLSTVIIVETNENYRTSKVFLRTSDNFANYFLR